MVAVGSKYRVDCIYRGVNSSMANALNNRFDK